MSSGGGSQTVTNKTDIDPVTQAWRTDLMNAGRGLYQQGFPEYYPGQTVVPFADQTMQGLDMLTQQAQAGAPQYQNAVNAAGRSFEVNPAMAGAMDTAQGGLANNPYASRMEGYGSANNPYLKGLWDQGSAQVSDAVNASFAKAGRFGGNAAHTGAMTRELGNLYNQIYAPAYEQERNRGLQADQTLAQMGDAGLNRTLQGQGLAADIWSQDNMDTQRMAAIMPSLYQYGSAPAQQLLGVGGAYEGLAGEYLADDMARYNYPYQGAWDHLNNYASITSGLPDFSNNATTSPVNRNRALGAMGGAMSGAQIGSNFGGWGSLIGAIGGGLFGAYG